MVHEVNKQEYIQSHSEPLKLTAFQIALKSCQALLVTKAGLVRTLIGLHHGRKTKRESLVSFRNWVNISGGSQIAWINVECSGDSLSVAVPSEVKKCYSYVTNSLLEATEEIQKDTKLQPCPRIYSFSSSYFSCHTLKRREYRTRERRSHTPPKNKFVTLNV